MGKICLALLSKRKPPKKVSKRFLRNKFIQTGLYKLSFFSFDYEKLSSRA